MLLYSGITTAWIFLLLAAVLSLPQTRLWNFKNTFYFAPSKFSYLYRVATQEKQVVWHYDASDISYPLVGDVAKAGVKPLLGKPAVGVIPNPYEGIQQASQYLQSMGVPRARRTEILRSFDSENIAVRQAGEAEFGLRFYSNPARPGGSYLFETFPASRGSLAIKHEWSSMTGFRQFQIRPGSTFLEGRAAPQGLYLPGSQTQKFILNWRKDLIP